MFLPKELIKTASISIAKIVKEIERLDSSKLIIIPLRQYTHLLGIKETIQLDPINL